MLSSSTARFATLLATATTTAAFLTLVAATPASAAPHAVQMTLYASPTGSGSACTLQSPCSLEGARDEVRAVNANMTGDIDVDLLGGTYSLSSTFTLTENTTTHDSGTNGFDVVYQAAPGANPILSGGASPTSAFTLHDSTKNIWQASVPTGLDTRQVYVDGVRATRARSATNPAMAVTATGYTLPTIGPYAGMANWGDIDRVEVVAGHSWKQARYSVAAISGSAMTMDTAGWTDGNTQPSTAARSMLWIENAYELLDAPGEWYLERSTNTLYYIPLPGQDPNSVPVILGSTVGLVGGAGTSATPLHNVVFNGVTFAYDTWLDPSSATGYPDFQAGVVYRGTGTWDDNNYMTPAGVQFKVATHIAIIDSTFTHMGNAALALGAGSQYDLIDHNTFTDISGTGIDLGGITKSDEHPSDLSTIVKNNVISNNTVTNTGVEYPDTPGIFLGYTQGSSVAHNTLNALPYTGISMGWGWGYIDSLATSQAKNNVVQGNLIYDFMKSQPDGGAIYTLGSQPGSKLVDNYVYADHGPYAYLYRDNGSSGFTDTNNVVNSAGGSLMTWYYTNTGSGGYWNATNNNASGNFYSSGMGTSGTGGSNVVGSNTAVAGAWPTAAQTVINNAGVGGTSITPVTAGDLPLSRGKTATASSSASGYGPANALDGDQSTRWQAASTSDPSWLTVDLGDTYVISSVSTSAYLASGYGVEYKIEYSADDVTWSMYADKTAQFTDPEQDSNTSSIQARYVRITVTATQGQGGSISEFDVFGNALPPASQGKIATASSTYSSTYSPSAAVDGDPTTRWAQQSGGSDPQWLSVDLGADYLISKVNTSAYVPSELGVKYKIEYATDSNSTTWLTYADKTGSYSIPGSDTNSATIIGRYVRITLTATQGQGSSLYEFQVYGSPYPISQGKTATASSQYSATYSPSMALDGNPATRWAQQSGAADPSSLTVDLGALYALTSVNTSAYLTYGVGVKYKIDYSADNANWSSYADRTGAYSVPGTDTNPGSTVGRYVRITLTDTQHQGGSIWDFHVYGTLAPPISQGKSASASSVYSGAYVASKAVDGDPTTRWAQQSGASDPQSLTVDLGASHSIFSVSTTAYLSAGLGVKYKIEWSQDGTTWSSYADRTTAYSTPGVDTNPASITGRYVRITITDSHGQGSSLYEFKVYGS